MMTPPTRTRIKHLKGSLEHARRNLLECKNKRVAFEENLDLNSCEEHRALADMSKMETKLEAEVKTAESKLERERRRILSWSIATLAVCLTVGASISWFVSSH